MTEITPEGGLKRRSVVTAAAWTVPAVAIAAGAPLAAASPGVPATVTLSNSNFDRNDNHDITVTITDALGNPVVGASVTATVAAPWSLGDTAGATIGEDTFTTNSSGAFTGRIEIDGDDDDSPANSVLYFHVTTATGSYTIPVPIYVYD